MTGTIATTPIRSTARRVILHLFAALILGFSLAGSGLAEGTAGTSDLPIFRAVIDESRRAQFAQGRLDDHGRDYVIYLLKMDGLDEGVLCAVGCDAASTYTVNRDTAGTWKWLGLKLGNVAFFSGIAKDLTFEPLPDTIDKQGGTNATEFLQMAAAEQIKGLIHKGGGLEDVNDTLSMTYAFSTKDRALVMAPNALHLVEGAKSADGDALEPSKTAEIFTKHAFLARVLNDEQRINMAGEMYMRIEPRDGVPAERVLTDGEIDLDKVYDKETAVLDLDLVSIDLVVKNDSGSFKPSGGEIAAFAWTLMKALAANRVGFEAFGAESQSGFVEDQGHSSWEEYRAANPAPAGR